MQSVVPQAALLRAGLSSLVTKVIGMKFNMTAIDHSAPHSLGSADGPLQRVLLQVTLVLSDKLSFSNAWQFSTRWEICLSTPFHVV